MKTPLFSLCLAGWIATPFTLSAQTTTDPLASVPGFTPTLTISESVSDSIKTTSEATGDPEFPYIVTRETITKSTSSVSLTANITGINLAEITTATSFSISVGGLSASGSLGDDPTFTEANQATKKSIFIPANLNDSGKAVGSNGVKLSWTATKLTATLARSVADQTDIGSVASETHAGGSTEPPAASPIKDVIEVSVAFGPITGEPRPAYLTGSTSTRTQRYGSDENGDLEEFPLNTVSISGGFDTAVPTISILTPKTGSILGPDVTLTGKGADGHKIQRIEYTTDLATTEPWKEVSEFEEVPPTVPTNLVGTFWGATTWNWTLQLTGLPFGTNNVWLRIFDVSGNVSKPAQITLINPIPILLTGRWDGLVDPTSDGVRGCITFTCDAKGAVSGKLTLEGTAAALPFTGAWSGETMQATIKRTGKPSLLLTAVMDSPDPNTVGDAALNCELVEAAGTSTPEKLLGAANAFRSPFSKTSKVPAAGIGRFHVGIAKPANPAGHGYFSIVTVDVGTTTLAGKLADGTGLTYSGMVGALGQVPIYIPLYTNKGSFTTLQWLDLMTGDVADADSFWNRPVSVADKQFPLGFSHTLTTSGQKYLPPGKDIRIMQLSTSIAQAFWSGDNVPVEITQDLDVSPAHKIGAIGGTAAFKATVVPATGILTGTFNVSSPTGAAAWSALIIGSEAYGHYIVPASKGSTAKPHGGIRFE